MMINRFHYSLIAFFLTTNLSSLSSHSTTDPQQQPSNSPPVLDAFSQNGLRRVLQGSIPTWKDIENQLPPLPPWLQTVAKVFNQTVNPLTSQETTTSDAIVLHQIVSNISLPLLLRIVKAYDQVTRAGHRYMLLYISIGEEENKNSERDIAMIREALPDSSIYIIDRDKFLQSSLVKESFQLQNRLNSTDNSSSSSHWLIEHSDLPAMVWFSGNRNDLSEKSFFWVMKSEVGWVGDLGMIIEKLQFSSGTIDYQATGCVRLDEYFNFSLSNEQGGLGEARMEDESRDSQTNHNNNNNQIGHNNKLSEGPWSSQYLSSVFSSVISDINNAIGPATQNGILRDYRQCGNGIIMFNAMKLSPIFRCFTSFVRYSHRMLLGMCSSVEQGNLLGSKCHAMSLAHRMGLSYADLLDNNGKFFEGDTWKRYMNKNDLERRDEESDEFLFSRALFEEYEQEYSVRSTSPLIIPTRPVGLLFRKLKWDS